MNCKISSQKYAIFFSDGNMSHVIKVQEPVFNGKLILNPPV